MSPALPSDSKPSGAAPVPLRVLLILSALMSFTSISTDIYLPALPAIAVSLRAEHGQAELTMTAFLIGFSLGQLLWGPIGDRHGRRGPIMAGLALFVAASLGCALSGSVWQMLGWRVLQAAGACAAPVLARATVRDLYTGEHSARMMSTLMLVMSVAPLVGPLLGGQILAISSWQGIFLALAAVGCMALPMLRALPETLPPERRVTTPLSYALIDYLMLARNPRLMGCALSGGFFFGGIYAYLVGTPFAYIDYYHVSPQRYGLIFSLNIVGMMAANFANARLVMRVGSERMLRLGAWGVALSGCVIALNAYGGWGGLAGLVAPIFFFISMNGLIVANSIAGALSAFPHRAGSASSLVGAIHYGSGILSSALIGRYADGTPWTMGWLMGACGVCCLISAVMPLGVKRRAARRGD